MKKIILAGGCFWGVEAYFARIKGVVKTTVGYVNGNVNDPTYEEVCSGNTGYAEGCYIEYNEELIELSEVLNAFWKIIDPTLINRQGHDIGNQYRTGIYYYDEMDLEQIKKSRTVISQNYSKPIVTEIEKVRNYYKAEEYHQKYLGKNPNGYCHIPKDLFTQK